MLKEDAGMEDAAADVHAAWMSRNKKIPFNAAQHVPYKDLPEHEKEKDRKHITMAGRFFAENPKGKDESHAEHHERIANMIGTHIHDAWRSSRKVIGENPDGTVRYEPRDKEDEKVGGSQDIANTPFHELTAGHKEENYLAGHAAVAAYVKHMSGINESFLTKRDLMATSTKELRKIGDTHSRAVSVIRERAEEAKKNGDHKKADDLHAQANRHQDHEMNIREIINNRVGMK
jgi:hypothetical protein